MYVGDVHDGSGVRQLLCEVVGNAIDEHLAGRTTTIEIVAESDDGWNVENGGAGIREHVERESRAMLEPFAHENAGVMASIARHDRAERRRPPCARGAVG